MADANVSRTPVYGCALEPSQLKDQLERYRQLSEHVTHVHTRPGELEVQFRDDVPAGLLEHALAVEQDCCSFLRIAYEPAAHRLKLAVPPARKDGVLAAIAQALGRPREQQTRAL